MFVELWAHFPCFDYCQFGIIVLYREALHKQVHYHSTSNSIFRAILFVLYCMLFLGVMHPSWGLVRMRFWRALATLV